MITETQIDAALEYISRIPEWPVEAVRADVRAALEAAERVKMEEEREKTGCSFPSCDCASDPCHTMRGRIVNAIDAVWAEEESTQ